MPDIIPKELPRLPKWINILFYVFLILLIAAIVSFFFLRSSINDSIEKLEALSSQISAKNLPETNKLEAEIMSYRTKFQDFKIILGEHRENTRSFYFLEEIVHPFVWFSSYTLHPGEEKLVLSGVAKDFNSLGQQILVLKERKDLTDFKLLSSTINKFGQIDFELVVYFKPGYLNAKN